MVKILRVKQAGTGSGGTGNPKAVPNIQKNPKAGSARDPAMLRAYAALRDKARKQISGSSIGSKGKL